MIFDLCVIDFEYIEPSLHGMELRMFSYKQEPFFGPAMRKASAEDFCRAFHQDMDVLYWLALTLTSEEQAEQCFVASLEECMDGNAVFKECAGSWSRRVIIRNAIRLMSPHVTPLSPAILQQETSGTLADVALTALAQLQPFDRFVFVMSVLEGYTDPDCAIQLECASTDVAEARLRALQHVRQRIELSSAWPKDYASKDREAVTEAAGTDADNGTAQRGTPACLPGLRHQAGRPCLRDIFPNFIIAGSAKGLDTS